MKRALLSAFIVIATLSYVDAQNVNYEINNSTGALSRIWMDGGHGDMNWIVATDASQYPNIGEKYGWGLGYLDILRNDSVVHAEWMNPESLSDDKNTVVYLVSGIEITVSRRKEGGNMAEMYTFRNMSDKSVKLESMGIYTPFNDNYPDSETCLLERAHAHVWTGENAAYANLFHMGAKPPHLGLVVLKGSVSGYDIWERNSSNFRGIFALSPENHILEPDQSFSVEWKLFANSGWDDFFRKLVSSGSVYVNMNKYTFEKGEKAEVVVTGPEKKLKNCLVSINGKQFAVSGKNGIRRAELTLDEVGEWRVDINYGNNEKTHAEIQVRSSYDGVVAKRADFILAHQQMNNPADPRWGAYMVYDNELDKIYLNDTPNANPGDRSEGAERLGMGVFMAKYCLMHPDDKLLKSLVLYAGFVRRGLQDAEYNTWRSMSHAWGNRMYNYSWVAEFYFLMYKLTGEKQYALDGYGTLKAFYRTFGYSCYPVGQPVKLSLECLKETGLDEEYNSLLEDYKMVGNGYIKTSLNFPKHEVNYEQNIIGPSVVFLTDMYLLTKEDRYLEEIERQLPALEAFNGMQPSFHLYDIGIRHWDGFWLGKREMWGDTMPHYWSCLTAQAFYNYYLCTGDSEYRNRAKYIIENNLCHFTEDGRGYCVYIYPDRVNGVNGKFYDPYSNDQDWALSFYLDMK